MKHNELHTDQIRLRAPEPEDLDYLFLLENEASLWENGTATGPYSRYQLGKYLAESQNDLYADGQLRLMIECTDGKIAGTIDLTDFSSRHNRAEVGIVIGKQFRRKGIARAALRLLESHCFCTLGIHQLYAYIRADNEASLHLFLSAGYTVSGTLADWLHTGTGFRAVCIVQKTAPSV